MLSEKFEEFIVDEDEIFEVMEAVDTIYDTNLVNPCDQLDITYKYAKLFFKESNKQISITTKEKNKGPEEKSQRNQKEHLKVIKRLFKAIKTLEKSCGGEFEHLKGFNRKIFLLISSMFIIGLKFPESYGFS